MRILRRAHLRQKQAGFTLIEILLVVGIIAFLSTITLVNIFKSRTDTDRKSAQLGTKVVFSAASRYFLDLGAAPSSIKDLMRKPEGLANWRGPYLEKNKSTDPWGTEYVLKAPGDHQEVDVISLGSDRKPGGSGHAADIGNWE